MYHPIEWPDAWIGITEEGRWEQILSARSRGLPAFEPVDTEQKGPLAIVAGGPSLAENLSKLQTMTVMVCGTAHDYLRRAGIVPKYAVMCDAGAFVRPFLEVPSRETIYLVATQCRGEVYDHLAAHGAAVVTWNALHGEHDRDKDNELWVRGGPTTATRAVYLAFGLGYRDIHFFGLDSCYAEDNSSHAYTAPQYSDENVIEVFTEDGRAWRCQPYQALQADCFMEMLPIMTSAGSVTVHGRGLISHMVQIHNSHIRHAERAAA